VWLVNCDVRLTQKVAVATLFRSKRPPLISFDLVLRIPHRPKDRLLHPVRRWLLTRADHHIHLFRDVTGYNRYYGIGPDRSSFIDFKVNLAERHTLEGNADGSYVLCFGRSMRDFDTFFAAAETIPYPAAIARPNLTELRAHGARFSRSLAELPKNVSMLDDDGTEAAQVSILRGAKVVVLPVLKSSIVASGISTCLNAMALGKCVVGSDGPGMSDVFTNGEVLVAPPEDPAALAATIRRAWENDAVRYRTAAAGYEYAHRAGGEAELFQRLIDRVVEWRRGSIPKSGTCFTR
jgi:glycosyltransferase involved in cell wall biosynthesis